MDGIIFRMRSSCHWNRLPWELGDDSTIHRTFQRWVELGVLERIWAVLVEGCDELGGVNWEWQAADCAMGKAGNKRSILVDGSGGPLSVVVAGANVHDTKLLAMTLESVVVEHPEGRVGPQHLCLDKGYDNPTGHQAVAAHGYRGHIRRVGEREIGRHGRKTLSRPPLGGGAHLGLAIQVPGDPGALRQEGMQLHGPGAIGLRPAMVSPPTPTQVLG